MKQAVVEGQNLSLPFSH